MNPNLKGVVAGLGLAAVLVVAAVVTRPTDGQDWQQQTWEYAFAAHRVEIEGEGNNAVAVTTLTLRGAGVAFRIVGNPDDGFRANRIDGPNPRNYLGVAGNTWRNVVSPADFATRLSTEQGWELMDAETSVDNPKTRTLVTRLVFRRPAG